MTRTMFYISDRTAITAETIGHSLLAQFEGTSAFREVTIPYVDSPAKARQAVELINQAHANDDQTPLVFSTLVEPESRALIIEANALVLDLFHEFLEKLQRALKAAPLIKTQRSHRISNMSSYEARISAMDYSLQHDDGAKSKNYDQADIIMIGVSRSGKTPTCLYLALQFGIRAANYPITEEDLTSPQLPVPLRPYIDHLHGLTIQPRRLASIREQRRPGGRYSSLEQCRTEVKTVERLYRSYNVPYINTTDMSVEEIATKVAQARGLDRHSH